MTLRMHYTHLAAEGMKALAAVNSYVRASGLEPSLIDLVYLRVSQINGCAFCIDAHGGDLLKAGVAPEKLLLVQVWRDSEPLFTAREQAALAWAETVTRIAETAAPDADYAAAVAVFGEKALADLTIAIGLMNTYNRLGISFRAPPTTAWRAARPKPAS